MSFVLFEPVSQTVGLPFRFEIGGNTMNTCELLVNFFINLVAGIIGILIVLWIERQRRPRLTIKLGQPVQINEEDPLHRPLSIWLHVQIHNKNVPKWLAWVYDGEPALACRAWISFYHLNGQRLFDREMVARWFGSDEPKVEVINTREGQALRLIGAQTSFDIPPGEYTDVDVVFRAKEEDDCYGWNNESYLHNWHHPDWRLEKGRYIARVRAKTGGREYTNTFLIANDVPYIDFKLIEIDEETKKKYK
jgi:hypothetical protein